VLNYQESIVNIPKAGLEICGNEIDDDKNGKLDCGEAICAAEAACICFNGLKDPDETGVDCGGTCGTCAEQEEPTFVPTSEQVIDTPITTEKTGSNGWLWFLFILLILGGGGFFFYIKYVKTGKVDISSIAKFFKKKKGGPSFDDFKKTLEFKPVQSSRPQVNAPARRPISTTRQAARSKDEDALDRSLKEAERLLKGK
jgi:hypothetical protein